MGGGGGCTWAKPGRFGSFFVLCFLALGEHCLQMLCVPGFGTHANTQNPPHFLVLSLPVFRTKAKLPNRPGFALLRVRGGYKISPWMWGVNFCCMAFRCRRALRTVDARVPRLLDSGVFYCKSRGHPQNGIREGRPKIHKGPQTWGQKGTTKKLC